MDPTILSRLRGSIASDNLVIICGAGLSMAKPSGVPSAAAVASQIVSDYAKVRIPVPAHVANDLGAVSSFAYGRGELRPLVIRKFVNWAPFIRNPNSGHYAVADFLGAKVISFAVTTNYDELVERAAENLGESICHIALDGHQAAQTQPHASYLKIHGCCRVDKENTVWCIEQLSEQNIKDRIASAEQWLKLNLHNKDVVFVGFWSDWDYLQQVFQQCVVSSEPRLVVVVSPSPTADLATKAPILWAWATCGKFAFKHEQSSGDKFLDELREDYSIGFAQAVLDQSKSTYTSVTGKTPPTFSFGPGIGSNSYYELRRDILGLPDNFIVRHRIPPSSSEQVGVVQLRLLAAGAQFTASGFQLGADNIRVIQGNGRVLSALQATHNMTPVPGNSLKVICAGAREDGGAPNNIARSGTGASIVRPTTPAQDWLTEAGAITQLGI